MVSITSNQNYFEFTGLSTDEKPIGSNCLNKNVDFDISNGSIFFEMDTSTAYMLKLEETIVDDTISFIGSWIEI